jgi:hypothetical protein
MFIDFLIVIFSLFWIYSLQEIIYYVYNSYNFKLMSLVNYTIWWLLSVYGEYNRILYNSYKEYSIIVPLCLYSLNLFYLYELYYYKSDFAHSLHHILTILIQCYMIHVDFFSDNIHLIIGVSAYWSHITSSLSALRYLTKNSKKYKLVVSGLYRLSYVIFKGFSIIAYYFIFINYFNFLKYKDYIILFCIYTLIHINQLYFMFIIINNYRKRIIRI